MALSFTPNELVTVQVESNLIEKGAFTEVYTLLQEMGANDIAIELNRMFTWSNVTSPWRQWMIEKEGKWTKRFSSYLYKSEGIKIDSAILEKIGEILKRHVNTAEEVHFEIAKFSDWSHGSFEPSRYSPDGSAAGKCWWGQYASTRKGLVQDPKGYSILFYNSLSDFVKYQQKQGIGRCWMYMPDENSAVVFNAYGKYSLTDIAGVLSNYWKLPNAKIKLHSNEAYVNAGSYNNDGRGGGSNGLGYFIGKDAPNVDTYHLPDLRYKDVTCYGCSRPLNSETSHKGYNKATIIYLCPTCQLLYTRCTKCRNQVLTEHTQQADRGSYIVCNDCAKRLPKCKHGLILTNSYKIWHTSRYACRWCIEEGAAEKCMGCGHYLDAHKIKTTRLKYLRVDLCLPCLQKVRKHV